MKTVSNTTPIISFSPIGRIEILKDIFQEIIIPQAVFDEIKVKQGYGYNEVDLSFIKVQAIQNTEQEKFLLDHKLLYFQKKFNADNDKSLGKI